MSASMPLLGEEPPGQLGVLAGHPDALGQVGHRLDGRVAGDGHHDAHRLGGGLRVLELAERHDVAGGLLDPVAAGDAEVEQALGHVLRDLLGPQDADLVDAGVVDRGLVVDAARPVDLQVGLGEQLHRRLLERSLGQHDLQHGPTLRVTPPVHRICMREQVGIRPVLVGIFRQGRWRWARRAISTATRAASSPTLWPPGPSERARAWSRFSTVSSPKAIGHAGGELHLLDALRRPFGDELVVGGLAPDHDAEGDDGVDRARAGEHRRAHRDLEAARARTRRRCRWRGRRGAADRDRRRPRAGRRCRLFQRALTSPMRRPVPSSLGRRRRHDHRVTGRRRGPRGGDPCARAWSAGT